MNPLFNNLNSFLLSPNSGQKGSFSIYELSPVKDLKVNCFVLMPYQNPQVKKPRPLFYEIIKKSEIVLTKNEVQQKPILLCPTTSQGDYIQNLIAL